MDQLEMLMAREQLMEDIISIVDEYDLKKGFATKDELEEILCDAVCRNFPAKWYKLVSRPTSWQGGTLPTPKRPTLCL